MKENKRIIILITASALLVLGALLIDNKDNNSNLGVLTPQESLSISQVRLAAANNALDGTGNFTENLCAEMQQISKKLDSKNEFLNCASPNLLYLATPDTSDHLITTISDEAYTAKFITNIDGDKLIDYFFSASSSAGFNNFGGRK